MKHLENKLIEHPQSSIQPSQSSIQPPQSSIQPPQSSIQPSRPQRGRTPNNRGWNDRREWNLRIPKHNTLTSPKGANRRKKGCGSPPSGTMG